MSRHSVPALRTALGTLVLFGSLVACDPEPGVPVALAEQAPAATALPLPPAAPGVVEPLPVSGCGSERNPCAIEGITVTARRQSARG